MVGLPEVFQATPRTVTGAPPSAATSVSLAADVLVIADMPGVKTVGIVAADLKLIWLL